MSADQTAIEDAIHAWVVGSTGLDPSKVIWEHQDTTRPADAFATLSMGDIITIGPFDQLTDNTDLTRPAGQEVELLIEGLREFVVRVQVFTHEITGNGSARAMLIRAQTRLNLPSVLEALDIGAELQPSDRGTVQTLNGLLGTSRFESRAAVDVRFYFIDRASDFTTYIETVGDLQGSVSLDGTVDIVIP